MKTKAILFLCIMLLSMSCDDDEVTGPEMKYEVITSSNTQWNGEFNDVDGNRIGAKPLNLPSGWTYAFHPKSLPFEMFVFAEANCVCDGTRADSEDVTINFYVNDKLVKTETNAWDKGVTSLLYKVE